MAGHMERYNRYLELNESFKSGSNDDKKQLEKLDELLTFGRTTISNKRPARFADYLYCGSRNDAHDLDLLNGLKITDVLNCAPRSPWKRTTGTSAADPSTGTNPYSGLGCGVVRYLEIDALDNESYPILRGSYERAKRFIDSARGSDGRVLVHCELGMNRSICLCSAYVVDSHGTGLLEVLSRVVPDRPNILTNRGFRRQLVEFASKRERKVAG